MRDLADFIARGAIHGLTALLSVLIAAFFAIAIGVAIGGTGGFTADPPPEHPAWIAAGSYAGIWLALQWGLLRLHKLFLARLDRLTGSD